eukprot:1056355-Pleurochrysis_carterae.AAC.1
MRSRSASFRGRSLASSFLSRVKDLRRSLEGGLPSVCMTRSWPAYAGKCMRSELGVRKSG